MGRIIKELLIKGTKGVKKLEVLFDSGASESVINENIAKEFCHILKLDRPRIFTLTNGTKLKVTGNCSFETIIESEQALKCNISGTVYSSPDYQDNNMIIGVPILQEYAIELKFSKEGDKIDLSKCAKRIDYL